MGAPRLALAVCLLAALASSATASRELLQTNECSTAVLSSLASNYSSIVDFLGTLRFKSVPSNFTIFLPRNEALKEVLGYFPGLNISSPGTYFNDNPDILRKVLSLILYHFSPAPLPSTLLGAAAAVPTLLEGLSLDVAGQGGDLAVVDEVGFAANLTLAAALPACNTVVYPIEQVLLPNGTLRGIPETKPSAFYKLLDPTGALSDWNAAAPSPAPAAAGR